MKKLLSILLVLMSINLIAQNFNTKETVQIIDLNKFYKELSGSFVLYDLNSRKYYKYKDSISAVRYSPCSTFKVANSLIGLESGVAKSKDYLIKYDSIRNPAEDWMYKREPFKHWMQDHTMETAIKNSVVWYYKELARRVGARKMSKLLKRINYGNNDISSAIDGFWLCGSLKVSANEQVEFLKKLYRNKLPKFSVKNQETVKNIMLYETAEKYKLYGKTGAGDCVDNKIIGWYVGFLETDSNTYIFAMNMIVNNYSDLGNLRIQITKDVFRELKLIK